MIKEIFDHIPQFSLSKKNAVPVGRKGHRAGNKVQNVGCPADNQHEYLGCPPHF